MHQLVQARQSPEKLDEVWLFNPLLVLVAPELRLLRKDGNTRGEDAHKVSVQRR